MLDNERNAWADFLACGCTFGYFSSICLSCISPVIWFVMLYCVNLLKTCSIRNKSYFPNVVSLALISLLSYIIHLRNFTKTNSTGHTFPGHYSA